MEVRITPETLSSPPTRDFLCTVLPLSQLRVFRFLVDEHASVALSIPLPAASPELAYTLSTYAAEDKPILDHIGSVYEHVFAYAHRNDLNYRPDTAALLIPPHPSVDPAEMQNFQMLLFDAINALRDIYVRPASDLGFFFGRTGPKKSISWSFERSPTVAGLVATAQSALPFLTRYVNLPTRVSELVRARKQMARERVRSGPSRRFRQPGQGSGIAQPGHTDLPPEVVEDVRRKDIGLALWAIMTELAHLHVGDVLTKPTMKPRPAGSAIPLAGPLTVPPVPPVPDFATASSGVIGGVSGPSGPNVREQGVDASVSPVSDRSSGATSFRSTVSTVSKMSAASAEESAESAATSAPTQNGSSPSAAVASSTVVKTPSPASADAESSSGAVATEDTPPDPANKPGPGLWPLPTPEPMPAVQRSMTLPSQTNKKRTQIQRTRSSVSLPARIERATSPIGLSSLGSSSASAANAKPGIGPSPESERSAAVKLASATPPWPLPAESPSPPSFANLQVAMTGPSGPGVAGSRTVHRTKSSASLPTRLQNSVPSVPVPKLRSSSSSLPVLVDWAPDSPPAPVPVPLPVSVPVSEVDRLVPPFGQTQGPPPTAPVPAPTIAVPAPTRAPVTPLPAQSAPQPSTVAVLPSPIPTLQTPSTQPPQPSHPPPQQSRPPLPHPLQSNRSPYPSPRTLPRMPIPRPAAQVTFVHREAPARLRMHLPDVSSPVTSAATLSPIHGPVPSGVRTYGPPPPPPASLAVRPRGYSPGMHVQGYVHTQGYGARPGSAQEVRYNPATAGLGRVRSTETAVPYSDTFYGSPGPGQGQGQGQRQGLGQGQGMFVSPSMNLNSYRTDSVRTGRTPTAASFAHSGTARAVHRPEVPPSPSPGPSPSCSCFRSRPPRATGRGKLQKRRRETKY